MVVGKFSLRLFVRITVPCPWLLTCMWAHVYFKNRHDGESLLTNVALVFEHGVPVLHVEPEPPRKNSLIANVAFGVSGNWKQNIQRFYSLVNNMLQNPVLLSTVLQIIFTIKSTTVKLHGVILNKIFWK